ncbi:MAG: TnsA endonuclease N-terminal domain-containing protein [Chloroflexaceae bacterium]
MEHDPDVLEYYDQPPPLTLTYRSPTDRQVTVRHTPDFFVLRTDGIVWEEWKPVEAMPALAARMPNRYTQDADGTWRCPPGEAAVAAFGGSYRVRTSAEIDWTLQRNLRFLDDYLRSDCPAVAPDVTAAVQAYVQERDGVTLAMLLMAFPADVRDDIYTLIAQEHLAVDVAATPLVEPERVWIVPAGHGRSSPHTPVRSSLPLPGTTVLWDGVAWLILNVGTTTITLLSQDTTVAQLPVEELSSLQHQGLLCWGDPNTRNVSILLRQIPSFIWVRHPANRQQAIQMPHGSRPRQPCPGPLRCSPWTRPPGSAGTRLSGRLLAPAPSAVRQQMLRAG